MYIGEDITMKWLSTLFDPWLSAMIGMSTPTDDAKTPTGASERFYMPALEVEVNIMSTFKIIPPPRKVSSQRHTTLKCQLWQYKGITTPKQGDVLALFP
jgi:hypothetical protein